MKRNHTKLWRSVISIGLAIILLFGSVVTAFADTVTAQTDTDTIKYVSLGDSMTNGFALPNYKNQGYQGYGTAAYPNQFAEWLEKETGKTVIQSQLAISGTRIEDIHFLLDFPMKDGEPDPAAVAVAETPASYWNETLAAEWKEHFSIGDWYTWDMLSSYRWKECCGGTDIAVKEYKKAISEADIISMATGNANFSVFGMERFAVALGTAEEDAIGNEWLDFEQAIATSDPEMQEYLRALKAELKAIITKELAALDSPELTEKATGLIDALAYVCVSYVLHYAETMEAIMKLNPDVEFILMGIMDTKSGINVAFEQEDGTKKVVNLMDLVGKLLSPVNTYIAGLPALLQKNGDELYSSATFYYAESPKIAVLGNEFEDYIDDPDSVTRERFIEGIVGVGSTGIVWQVLAPTFNEMNLLKKRNIELVPVTLENVLAYNAGKYDGLSDSEIFSCGVYMAVEKAVIKNSRDSAVDLNSLLSLTSGFEPQMKLLANEMVQNENKIFENVTIVPAAKRTEKILFDLLMSDETMKGLLHMIGRMKIGTGLGGHPTAGGHDALAEAFIDTYKTGYTAADKMITAMDNLMAVMLKMSPVMFDSQKQIVNKLKKTVNNLDSYAKAQLDGYASVKEAYTGKGLDAELNTVETELTEMRKAVKEVKAAIGDLAAAVSGSDAEIIENAAGVVDAKMNDVDAVTDDLSTAVNAAAKKAVNAGVDGSALKAVASEMRSYTALAAATKDIMKGESRQLAYAPTENSLYVALGDSSTKARVASNAYGSKVTKALGLDYSKHFSNEGVDGMRVEDLLYILDETYEPDEYAEATFGRKIDSTREALITQVEEADLITIGFSNNTLLEISIGQMKKAFGGKVTNEIDWHRYFDAAIAEEIDSVIADIETTVIEATAGMSGAGINMNNIGVAVRTAIESYLYNYIGFYMNYQDTINKIIEINPDAKIVLLGISNSFDGTNLLMNGKEIPLGEYMGKLTALMNLQQKSFAMMTGKATYVDASDVEVGRSTYTGDIDMITFISRLLISGIDSLAPSVNGHTYIKDQIMAVMNVVDPQIEAVMDNMAGLYDLLNLNVSQMNAANKQIEAARSSYDELTADQKEKVNAELVQLLEFCESDFEYVKAFAVGNSNVTNLKAKLPLKSKLTVSWTGVSGAQKYKVKIYRNGRLFKTVNTTAKSVSLANIYRGCTYKATVQPVATINGTSFTGIAKSASVTSKLGKASIIAKKNGSKVKVSSKDQNSTGFQVWVSTNKKFNKNVIKKTFRTNGNALKSKAIVLKKGTNYVKVRAYTTINGKTVYGTWSVVKRIKR